MPVLVLGRGGGRKHSEADTDPEILHGGGYIHNTYVYSNDSNMLLLVLIGVFYACMVI